VAADLNKNAFWDGASVASDEKLDANDYKDASEAVMPLSGRSVASLLPSIPGVHGTVIKSAGEHGAPVGYDPNAVAQKIHVDPDIPGESFIYNPAKIGKEALVAAINADKTDTTSIEARRFKAANVLKQFAISEEPDSVQYINKEDSASSRVAPVDLPGTYVVPESTDGGRQLSTQNADKNVVFGRKPAPLNEAQPQTQDPVIQPREVHAASFVPEAPQPPGLKTIPDSLFRSSTSPTSVMAQNGNFAPMVPRQPQAPEIKVAFEVKGTPFKTEAYYHAVVRNGSNLILIFDNEAVGYPKMFPQATTEEIAVFIEGNSSIYITKVHRNENLEECRFEYDGNEFCILSIVDEHPLQQ